MLYLDVDLQTGRCFFLSSKGKYNVTFFCQTLSHRTKVNEQEKRGNKFPRVLLLNSRRPRPVIPLHSLSFCSLPTPAVWQTESPSKTTVLLVCHKYKIKHVMKHIKKETKYIISCSPRTKLDQKKNFFQHSDIQKWNDWKGRDGTNPTLF